METVTNNSSLPRLDPLSRCQGKGREEKGREGRGSIEHEHSMISRAMLKVSETELLGDVL